MSLISSVLLCASWAPVPRVGVCTPGSQLCWRAAPIVAEVPFKTDDEYSYFRRKKDVDVALKKPLGAVLEEMSMEGVVVASLQEGGSALETGLLKKGDAIRSIQGKDVSQAGFDEVSGRFAPQPFRADWLCHRALRCAELTLVRSCAVAGDGAAGGGS